MKITSSYCPKIVVAKHDIRWFSQVFILNSMLNDVKTLSFNGLRGVRKVRARTLQFRIFKFTHFSINLIYFSFFSFQLMNTYYSYLLVRSSSAIYILLSMLIKYIKFYQILTYHVILEVKWIVTQNLLLQFFLQNKSHLSYVTWLIYH
jgi:hypothetical protein